MSRFQDEGEGQRFVPHNPNVAVEFLGSKPRIYITERAYNAMHYIVALSGEEVSWLGVVERKGMLFLISEIFLFDQEVSGTHTYMDPDSLTDFFVELASTDEGVAKANKIRFWGHSHVRMGVGPSGSYAEGFSGDLATMYRFQGSSDYFIMGIANKHGALRFEVFLYDSEIRLIDVPWTLVTNEDNLLKAEIQAELEEKVKSLKPVPRVGVTYVPVNGYVPPETERPQTARELYPGRGGKYGRQKFKK